MAYNGSGTYDLPAPQYPAIPGQVIYAEDFNDIVADIAAALSLCLVRDGQAPMIGDLNMGGQDITNLASISAVLAGLVINGTVTFAGAVSMLTTLNVTGGLTVAGPVAFPGGGTTVTKAPGTNTTDLATCAFVLATAMNAALPNQAGNAGRFLQTDGVNANWVLNPLQMVKVDRSSNTIFAESNRGNLINYTAGSFVQTMTAAASLAAGWFLTTQCAMSASSEGVEIESPASVSTTSVSSLNITSATVLTVATGLTINPGDLAIVRRTSANYTTRMWGTVASYVSGTGALTLTVQGRVGSGTFSDWTVTTRPAANGIDGLPSYVLWPGEKRRIYIDGTGFRSIVEEDYYITRTSSFFYVHPPGYEVVESDLVGGGGGGGSGSKDSSSVSRAGGAPGGAPGRVRRRQFGLVPGNVYVGTIGAAGTGGAAQTVAGADGTSGTAGGDTTFNGITAFGGVAGLGGNRGAPTTSVAVSSSGSGSGSRGAQQSSAGGGAAGGGPGNTAPGATAISVNVADESGGSVASSPNISGGNSLWGGAGAASVSPEGTGIVGSGSSLRGVPAGGVGGQITSGSAMPATAGAAGLRGVYTPGGLTGGTTGAAPTAGQNGATAATDEEVGGSGSGGGSTTTAAVNAGAGGAGGFPGGAGGGGGASGNTGNSGPGGNGAAGRIILKGNS